MGDLEGSSGESPRLVAIEELARRGCFPVGPLPSQRFRDEHIRVVDERTLNARRQLIGPHSVESPAKGERDRPRSPPRFIIGRPAGICLVETRRITVVHGECDDGRLVGLRGTRSIVGVLVSICEPFRGFNRADTHGVYRHIDRGVSVYDSSREQFDRGEVLPNFGSPRHIDRDRQASIRHLRTHTSITGCLLGWAMEMVMGRRIELY